MSQHSVHTKYGDHDVVVVAGYARPLNDLFLRVLDRPSSSGDAEEKVLYSSLNEPKRDWADINTLVDRVTELGIEVPVSLLEAVFLDQLLGVGNRMVLHHLQGPSEVLLAG